MKVFLAGATGAIGRRLVPMLGEAGHEVTGMTRRPEGARELEAAGARAAVCDVFDAEAVREAVVAARPDAVIHQLTDIPKAINPRRFESEFAGNDRIRVEGTRNLVAAAAAAGARRFVAQSIAFAYPPSGSPIKTEDDPLFLEAPRPWKRSIEALEFLERSVLESGTFEGVVLRYGHFYGPGTAYASDGHVAALVRGRRFPVVGNGAGLFSFIHVDDAARATVAALERGGPGALNVVDDEPAPASEWIPEYARAIGAKPPPRAPRLLARLLAGPHAVVMMTEMRGASNARAKEALGWSPRLPSWRVGFREALG